MALFRLWPPACRAALAAYWEAHLGNIYLELGDPMNAETHFRRAWELWPSEDNEKNLVAICKRLALQTGKFPSK